MQMDLLLTGATGFLGSQLATQWLSRDPEARVACVVRGSSAQEARARLDAALALAVIDQGMAVDLDALLGRVTVLHGELDGPDWVDQAVGWVRGAVELVHCAANLSFREADRAAVWQANVGGTAAVLAALAALPQVTAFNYVSTAYVAGDREGEILEHETVRPSRFNNPYEESKWTAEQSVRAECKRLGRPYRIFRPSIIIAHSVTFRLSSASGFYKVAETLLQLGGAKRRDRSPIHLPVPSGATLDLIPVDVVVTEMLDLIGLGPRSTGETYHLTSAVPLSLAAVLSELTPMSGLSIGSSAAPGQPSRLTALVMRSLHHYMPYFAQVRHFARHQAGARGVPGASSGLALDIAGLRAFLTPYLADHAIRLAALEA